MPDAVDPQPELGEAIRRLRERSGLTQEAFALKAGIDRTWVTKIETGRANPAWGTVRKLLRALDVTLPELTAAIDRIERE